LFQERPVGEIQPAFSAENALGQRESGAPVSLHLCLFGASQTKNKQTLIVPTLEQGHDQRFSESKTLPVSEHPQPGSLTTTPPLPYQHRPTLATEPHE
jgi:hypothetical protein